MERLSRLLLIALLAAGISSADLCSAIASNAGRGSRIGLPPFAERYAAAGSFALSPRLAMTIGRDTGREAVGELGRDALRDASRDAARADALDPAASFLGAFNAAESRLFADAADGRFDAHTLLEASLVASGAADGAELRRYVELFEALESELKRNEKLSGSPLQQAEAVFEFLHHRILRGGYRLEGTDLRTALEEGRFNCVSATVLYNCLAAGCGLTTCALESPGHAMSRVMLPEGAIDVETTCPRWFKLMHDPKRQAEYVAKNLGLAATRDRSQMREVGVVQVAAMIYYNRGVDLLAAKRFSEAAAANAKAMRLDPVNRVARGNLLATINNWAIHEGVLRNYAGALELLRRGMAIDGNFAVFRQNYAHVCRQWSLDLLGAAQYEAAVAVLRDALAAAPDPAPVRAAIAEVYRQWAAAAGQDGDATDVLRILQEAKADLGLLPEFAAAEAAALERLAAAAPDYAPAPPAGLQASTPADFQDPAMNERPKRSTRREAATKERPDPRTAPE